MCERMQRLHGVGLDLRESDAQNPDEEAESRG